MVVMDAVDDPVDPSAYPTLGLEVEDDSVDPVLGQRPEGIAAGKPRKREPPGALDHPIDDAKDDRGAE